MYRIRWFDVAWNSKYNTVVDAIISDVYTEEKYYGFTAHKRRDDILEGSYISKKEIEETIENPLTNEATIYQRVIYEKTLFNLENNQLGIELINPPRGVQNILNSFASMSKFNIAIKPLSLDLSKLIQLLRPRFNNFSIHGIECKDIHISENTDVKLTAKNSQSDVSEDIDIFLDKKKYTINKIKCSFELDNVKSVFELSHNGSLKTNKNNLKLLLPIIKGSIKKTIQS